MSTSSSSPRRLPDELVIMIIERCYELNDKCGKTLVALCQVNRAFKAAAERLLYSDVTLEHQLDAPPEAGSPFFALIHYPHLRPFVKRLDLNVEHDTLDAMNSEVLDVLGDLPNLEALRTKPNGPAAQLLLAHPDCNILSFEPRCWNADAVAVLTALPGAFANLEHLEVNFVDDSFGIPLPVLPSLKRLSFLAIYGFATLGPLVAPLVGQLATLCLTAWSYPVEVADLSACARLERLELTLYDSHDRDELDRTIRTIVATLKSVPRSPGLTSFAFFLLAVDPGGDEVAEASFELPASSNDILLALPRQLRHLSLVTNTIRPADLATFLMSSLRPSAMRILRLGDALGRGFRAILDDVEGVHGALAGELERAGIEVTTTAGDP